MADINVGMKVTGLNTFKADMKTAQTSVKTLKEELALAEAEYKANGDAEEYLKKKTTILAQEIEAQEKVVTSCKDALKKMKDDGVDPSSTAYVEWQGKLAKAKTELTNMNTALTTANTELETGAKNLDKMADSADDANTNLDKIAKNTDFSATIQAIDTIYSSVTNAAGALGGFAKELWNAGVDAGNNAQSIIAEAGKYGLSTEEYQRLAVAAQKYGVSVKDIVQQTDEVKSLMESIGESEWSETLASADIVDEETLTKSANAASAWKEVMQTFDNTKVEIFAAFAPLFEKICDLLKWVADNATLVATAFGTIKVAMAGLEFSKNLTEGIAALKELGIVGGKVGGAAVEKAVTAAAGGGTSTASTVGTAVKAGGSVIWNSAKTVATAVAPYLPAVGMLAGIGILGHNLYDISGGLYDQMGSTQLTLEANGVDVSELVDAYMENYVSDSTGKITTDLDDMQQFFEDSEEGIEGATTETVVALVAALTAAGVCVQTFATDTENAIAGILEAAGQTPTGGGSGVRTTNNNSNSVVFNVNGSELRDFTGYSRRATNWINQMNAGKGQK